MVSSWSSISLRLNSFFFFVFFSSSLSVCNCVCVYLFWADVWVMSVNFLLTWKWTRGRLCGTRLCYLSTHESMTHDPCACQLKQVRLKRNLKSKKVLMWSWKITCSANGSLPRVEVIVQLEHLTIIIFFSSKK